MKSKTRLWPMLTIVLLILGAVIMLFPYIWMVITSLKSNQEILTNRLSFFPQEPTLDGYRKVLTDAPFFRWFLNSLVVALTVCLFVLFTSGITGYILAKINFKGRHFIFILILSTMMLPPQVMLIPRFLIILKLNLTNNLLSLIIPSLVSGFGIYLCKQFMENIPNSLIEAARIDGANSWIIFYRIILPQITPGLSSLFIFIFMSSWNDYLTPLIYMNSEEMMTLPLALAFFNGVHLINYNIIMSAAVLIMLPVFILFILFQKNFVRGISISSLK